MKIERIKVLFIAAIFAFESVVVGYAPVSAQSVSENAVGVMEVVEEIIETEGKSALETEDVFAEKATIKYYGVSGDLSWSVDDTGLLTITGTGDYGEERPWLDYSEEIIRAEISVTGITTMSAMFEGLNNMKSIDLSGTDTSYATSMSFMFYGCSSLTSVDLSNVSTIQVTDMKGMFDECSSLENIDFGNINTSRVTDMRGMFDECSRLASLDVSGFDTSQVIDMGYMFYGCSSLASLNVSGFDTSQVIDMIGMFYGCSSLTSLDVSNFDTAKVTSMSFMFTNCSNLTTLDISSFDTTNVEEDMRYIMCDIFVGCDNLLKIISCENTSTVEMPFPENEIWVYLPTGKAVTEITKAGTYVCRDKNMKLPTQGQEKDLHWSIDEKGALTITGTGNYSNPTPWSKYKSEITSAKVSVTGITDTSMMFYDCSNLKSIDISGLDTSNVTNMGFMFSGCSSLEKIDLSKMNTSKVLYMHDMFSACRSLTNLNLSGFDTSNVTDMSFMFADCDKLGSLDISKFSTDKTKNMTYMLANCHTLASITLPAKLTCVVDFPQKIGYGWKNADGYVFVSAPTNLSKAVTYTLAKLAKTGTKMSDKKSGGKYEVTTSDGSEPTVAYVAPTNKKKTKVTIPEYVTYEGVKYKVTSVAAKAFKGNKKLKNISIASAITIIGEDAFNGCVNLKTVTVGKNLKTIGDNAFKNCKKLTKVTIKSTKLEKIGKSAFYNCASLKNLTFNSTKLTTIGKSAFQGCKKLTKITLKSTKLKSVGKNALKGVNKKCKIKVPKSKVKNYTKLFKNKGSKTVKVTK